MIVYFIDIIYTYGLVSRRMFRIINLSKLISPIVLKVVCTCLESDEIGTISGLVHVEFQKFASVLQNTFGLARRWMNY
jgi:hypothetical protein